MKTRNYQDYGITKAAAKIASDCIEKGYSTGWTSNNDLIVLTEIRDMLIRYNIAYVGVVDGSDKWIPQVKPIIPLYSGEDAVTETMDIFLSPDHLPKAYKMKVEELMDDCGMSQEEAEVQALEPIECEFYYQKSAGLFCVESGCTECYGEIPTPYGAMLVEVED